MKNVIAFTVIALLVAVAADPALAQWAGGGTPAPFQTGFRSFLNWVFIVGVLVALISFLVACGFAMMGNARGFVAGAVGVIIGAALMAKAPTIIQGLTSLNATI